MDTEKWHEAKDREMASLMKKFADNHIEFHKKVSISKKHATTYACLGTYKVVYLIRFCFNTYRLLPRKACNISFVARGVDICPRRSRGQHSSPRATKLMLHAFLGSTCFILLRGNGKLQSNLLVNCLKAHVTSLLLHTLVSGSTVVLPI